MIAPREVKHPLLLLIHLVGGDKASMKAHQTYDILADVLGLSVAERGEERDKNQGRMWHSTVQNARKALVEEHYLEPKDRVEPGEWKLTTLGRRKASDLLPVEREIAMALRARLGRRG
jgi:hypothetical protein